MSQMLSPCQYCTRVANPKNCENKKCVPWQKWFLNKWEQTRQLYGASSESAPAQQVGIPLGGNRYAHPHRVREYRQNGPCAHCKLPKDLCHRPCSALQLWQQEKENGHELEG